MGSSRGLRVHHRRFYNLLARAVVFAALALFSTSAQAQNDPPEIPTALWRSLYELTQTDPTSFSDAQLAPYVTAIPQMLTALSHPELFDEYRSAYLRAVVFWLSQSRIRDAIADKPTVAEHLSYLVLDEKPPLPAMQKTVLFQVLLFWANAPKIAHQIPIARLLLDHFEHRADDSAAVATLRALLKLADDKQAPRHAMAVEVLPKMVKSGRFDRLERATDPDANKAEWTLLQTARAKAKELSIRGLDTLSVFEVLGEVYFRMMLVLSLQASEINEKQMGKRGKLEKADAERLQALGTAIRRLNIDFGLFFCTQWSSTSMSGFVKFSRQTDLAKGAMMTLILSQPDLDDDKRRFATPLLEATLADGETVDEHLTIAAAEPLAVLDTLVEEFASPDMIPEIGSSSRTFGASDVEVAIQRISTLNEPIHDAIQAHLRAVESTLRISRQAALTIPQPRATAR